MERSFVLQNQTWRVILACLFAMRIKSNSLKGVFAPYPKETVQGGAQQITKTGYCKRRLYCEVFR